MPGTCHVFAATQNLAGSAVNTVNNRYWYRLEASAVLYTGHKSFWYIGLTDANHAGKYYLEQTTQAFDMFQ